MTNPLHVYAFAKACLSHLRASQLVILFSTLTFAEVAIGKGKLTVPKGLEPTVGFWTKIFNVYGSQHCVIHDSRKPENIFIVKEVPRRGWKMNRAINQYKKQVRDALRRLARRNAARSALERRVLRGIPKHQRKPSYYRSASRHLRCQRGVDIGHSLKNSQKYIRMIKRVFRKAGLPTDLAYLPHLESGFNARARSKAGARGIWQFMPASARYYGLKVGKWRDYRTNPYKSTVAAAKHLGDLKRAHKKWPLAVTAYNYGTNGMRRAIRKYGHDYMRIRKNHKTRIFGYAVKNYYPSFLAVRNIAMKMERSSTKLASRK